MASVHEHEVRVYEQYTAMKPSSCHSLCRPSYVTPTAPLLCTSLRYFYLTLGHLYAVLHAVTLEPLYSVWFFTRLTVLYAVSLERLHAPSLD